MADIPQFPATVPDFPAPNHHQQISNRLISGSSVLSVKKRKSFLAVMINKQTQNVHAGREVPAINK